MTRWSAFGKFEESLNDGDTENRSFKFGEAEHLSSFSFCLTSSTMIFR